MIGRFRSSLTADRVVSTTYAISTSLAVFCSVNNNFRQAPTPQRTYRLLSRHWDNCPWNDLQRLKSFHHFTATMSAFTVDICGKEIPVQYASGIPESDARKAVVSAPFKQWVDNMEGPLGILNLGGSGGARCSLRQIMVQSVDMFGSRVGFVKFKAEVVDDASGAKLPGIVFARGGAVGILILLEHRGDTYAVLTEQARVPVGRAILELPAGMMDDGVGDFVGTAAREVEEETGIKLNAAHLTDLTAFLHESTGRKMFPSPGGSDEEITLFLYRGTVEEEVFNELHGAQTGLRDHGELIQLHLVKYSELWRCSADCKVLAAVALYEGAMAHGLVRKTAR